jgi:hypothetical protein
MGTSVEKLMVWQPNLALQDKNHRPSIIASTIEKFQLKILCQYRGLNPGLLPYHDFDA